MVEVAAGAAVVVNEISAIDIATGVFIVIDAILALSAGTGRVSVIMDVAVEDLIVVGPNSDSTFGAVFDFETVNNIVAAIDVDADVAIGGILAVDDCPALNFGLQGDWTRRGSALAKMKSPAAVVVCVNAGFDDDGCSGGSKAVCLHNRSQWRGR